MAREMRAIDISGVPDMVRIAEEVRMSGRPRILRRNGEDMAMVIPLAHGRKRRTRHSRTQADYEAFLSSAGGWKDLVDGDKLLADIYESRELSTKPPIMI